MIDYINSYLYLKGIQCPKLFYLEAHNDTKGYHDAELKHYGHEYVKPYHSIHITDKKSAALETKKYIEETSMSLGNAVFIADGCSAVVDAVKQGKKGLILYMVKSSTKLKKEYKQEAEYLYYVVSRAGFAIQSIYVLTINSQYVRYGDIDARLLFTSHDVTMDAKDSLKQVHSTIEGLKEILLHDTPQVDISPNCNAGFGCKYHDFCFSKIEGYTIFDIGGLSKNKMYEYYSQGIISYEDILEHHIPLTARQVLQVESYVHNERAHMNVERIEYFLDQLTYPLYFLDFETFQVAVPRYPGCRPYECIAFQYSLHYINHPGGKLHHKEHLGYETEDPRKSLAKQLCEDIPLDACVLAYNSSFEKSVINSLAILYPEYRNHLLSIYPNVYDLQIPFQNGDYYHKDMHGSYSIKNVLPALCPDDPALDYHNLDDVHNGSEAMMSFIHLSKLEGNEKETMRANLLKYCNLDTLAMVKIYEKLLKDVEERKNEENEINQ